MFEDEKKNSKPLDKNFFSPPIILQIYIFRAKFFRRHKLVLRKGVVFQPTILRHSAEKSRKKSCKFWEVTKIDASKQTKFNVF